MRCSMRAWTLFSSLLLLILARPLAAQDTLDPIEPDRPDFTEGTGILQRGHWQAEGGYTFSRVEDEETSTLGELLVRIPLAESVEARLNIGSYDWIHGGGEKVQGYEDPEVGVKIRLPATGRPELAVLLLTTVPVGGKDLTADAWQPTVKLAAAWDLSDRFSLSSNLNVSSLAEGDDRFPQVSASLSAGFSLSDRLGAFLEAYGFSEETQGGPRTGYVNGGFSYGVTNDLSLDVRAGAGLNDASPDYFIGAGGAVRW
jgi:hypothetical protein